DIWLTMEAAARSGSLSCRLMAPAPRCRSTLGVTRFASRVLLRAETCPTSCPVMAPMAARAGSIESNNTATSTVCVQEFQADDHPFQTFTHSHPTAEAGWRHARRSAHRGGYHGDDCRWRILRHPASPG